MTARCPSGTVAALLGVRLHGPAVRRARVLDVALGEVRTMLDCGPLGPDVETARERAAAALWVLGAYHVEPGDEAFAWLRTRGLDAAREVPRPPVPEAAPVADVPPLVTPLVLADRVEDRVAHRLAWSRRRR